MNHRILERLWNRFRKTKAGRFLAAGIIGALFGLSAGASQSREPVTIVLAGLGGAAIGLFAVVILEALDSGRAKTHHDHRHRAKPRATGLPPRMGDVQSQPPQISGIPQKPPKP